MQPTASLLATPCAPSSTCRRPSSSLARGPATPVPECPNISPAARCRTQRESGHRIDVPLVAAGSKPKCEWLMPQITFSVPDVPDPVNSPPPSALPPDRQQVVLFQRTCPSRVGHRGPGMACTSLDPLFSYGYATRVIPVTSRAGSPLFARRCRRCRGDVLVLPRVWSARSGRTNLPLDIKYEGTHRHPRTSQAFLVVCDITDGQDITSSRPSINLGSEYTARLLSSLVSVATHGRVQHDFADAHAALGRSRPQRSVRLAT